MDGRDVIVELWEEDCKQFIVFIGTLKIFPFQQISLDWMATTFLEPL
jgi:hypothetical protein